MRMHKVNMKTAASTNETAPRDQPVTVRLGLADPAQRPGSDVVIFDGQCRFCQKQVLRLDRFDGGQRLSYLSLHDPRVRRQYPDLSHEQLMQEMYVVSPEGTRYGGAHALRYLSRRLPRLWWVAPLLHIPCSGPLWQWLYQRVAIRRYKLSQRGEKACDEDVCEFHLNK